MHLSLRRPPASLRVVALAAHRNARFKSTIRKRDLIGPPDPVSHLRPVIYDNSPASIQPTQLHHPYSLTEFNSSNDPYGDLELQYNLQRQQLDAFNHQFWLDTNTRFEAAKVLILDAIPESATALDKERALSHFYKQWLMQESEKTDAYTREWRRRNFAIILLGARVEYRRLCRRLSVLLPLRRA
ncbi:hypothetical protein AX17_003396 [Amanita inopinata Kibby_2008]|nr:hypothetical protein AX17_003396 [Amanita inopinata Kibby_2008]